LRQILKEIMSRLISAAFALALLAGSRLFAQPVPLSFCLVQIKPSSWTQYDPPSGPWAAEIYDLLSARKLANGAPLHITVLTAATEKELPSEVSGLPCPYVIQLRYHGRLSPGGRSLGEDTDSILFTLWNSEKRKAIANGASLIPAMGLRASKTMFAEVCGSLTQQILRGLNKLL
jgi:hypothetical protein